MDMPKDDPDPYTLLSGLTFVQNELLVGGRLTLDFKERTPTPAEFDIIGVGPILETDLIREDDETDGEYMALRMIAQHPNLHKPNTAERVVTEYVNRLMRHQYLRLSEEVDDSDEDEDTYQEMFSMMHLADLKVHERDDGTIDGTSMVAALGGLIGLSRHVRHVREDLPREERVEARISELERKVEELESLTGIPSKVEGSS